MTIRFTTTLTILILTTLLSGCGGVSQKDYDTLKAENEQLKKELDEIKNGADKHLAFAKSSIDSKDYQTAKTHLHDILDKHPESKEAVEAKTLLESIDQKISEQNAATVKAEADKIAADKERLANATKKLRSKYDDMKGITWYYDKSTPQYTNYNSFHLYLGQEKGSKPWLRFRIQYAADDWLFIQSYDIKTDNGSYTITPSYGEVETDNGSGGIFEWYDVSLDSRLYTIAKDVANSKTVKLRCNGKQYHNDRTISQSEKQGLKNILDGYEALGGDTNF